MTPQEQNQLTMWEIVQGLKHPDVLKMEQEEMERTGDDISNIQLTNFPWTGGVLTTMEGHPVPYKGFPYVDFVQGLDGVKKLLKYFGQRIHYNFRSLTEQQKSEVGQFWFHEKIIQSLFYGIWRVIERNRIRPERYSDPVREVYRVLSDMASLSKEERGENRILQFRDSFCHYLEFDNAYRFRFQDMMEDLNQTAESVKELARLYDLNIEREQIEEDKEKQAQYKDFLVWWFSHEGYPEILGEFFKRLDKEKVKLSPEDRYWCRWRKDYHFGFCERKEALCAKCFQEQEKKVFKPIYDNYLKLLLRMIEEKIKKVRADLEKVIAEQQRWHTLRVQLEAQLEMLLQLKSEIEKSAAVQPITEQPK